MTVALQMPVLTEEMIELSRNLWRKQILKKGTITYKGQKLTFDDALLAELAKSYKDGAFDQVPFQLADAANAHTADPERTRGEIRGVIATETGMDALIETDDAGSELIRNNPKLGVSCRIVPNLEQADGRKFAAAIEHVLGTLNPVVTGMTGWKAIALSNADTTVVDLTGSPYNDKEGDMPEPESKLTPEEQTTLKALLAKMNEGAPGGTGDASATGAGATGTAAGGQAGAQGNAPQGPQGVQGVQAGSGDQSELVSAELDKELEKLLADMEAERVGAAAGSDLSIGDRQALELATAQAQAVAQENAAIRAELDLAKFDREKGELIEAGIPPAVVDLAMPLLLGSGHAIDLANGSKADAGEVMRKVLTTIAEFGLVDFAGEHLPAPSSPAGDKTTAMLNQWQKQYPAATIPATA